MFLYSFLFPIIAVIAIVGIVIRYIKRRNSLSTVILWSIFWIFVILFSILPESSTAFASLFGITRGLDFVIILVFFILFYIVLKLYFIVDKMQNDLNQIVKEMALKNEITVDDEDE